MEVNADTVIALLGAKIGRLEVEMAVQQAVVAKLEGELAEARRERE